MVLSVIIPVYNERNTIGRVIERVKAVKLPGIMKEIIVIDGCSTDGTRELLADIALKQNIYLVMEEHRRGKGMAVRTGFAKATGDVIIIQDADLETNPEEYPQLLEPIIRENRQVVYGSRFKRGRGSASWGNYYGNWLVTVFMNMLFSSRLSDVATVYKVFRKDVIKDINFECMGFDFDIEITAKILKSGYEILEMPISYEPRLAKDGKKLHWFIGVRALLLVFKYRFFAENNSRAYCVN